ncbi:crinkler family protein [Gigaspora margarita]|uniref:Crinkler family protein n=1 Tax=Gigaspora margarita TaxID=4874 RepID=A0A8H4ADS4_GIGMA|nr:crinkler family protein [Gigaspora margarita]
MNASDLITSYLTHYKKHSYQRFLEIYNDEIVDLSTSDNWQELNNFWACTFKNTAKNLLNKNSFASIKKKVDSEYEEDSLKKYWKNNIKKCGRCEYEGLNNKKSQAAIKNLVKELNSRYRAIPIGNEASRSLYISSYLVAVLDLTNNRLQICPEKTISGPNKHGPLDYALTISKSSKIIAAVEVKSRDYLQGIAQNTVQYELILANGRKTAFGIITDSENWYFLKVTLDNDRNPIFQLSEN